MHCSKSKQIPGKYPQCKLLEGRGSKGGSENEKGDTSRYLLLPGYPVTEREKRRKRRIITGVWGDIRGRLIGVFLPSPLLFLAELRFGSRSPSLDREGLGKAVQELGKADSFVCTYWGH